MAAVFNISKLLLVFAGWSVLLVMLGFIVSSSGNQVLGQQGCAGDVEGLAQQCARYVQKAGPKTNPSQACCDIIKKVDVPCVCKQVTKDVEKFISMEKVVFLVAYCGKPLPHGIICGSYKVPLA